MCDLTAPHFTDENKAREHLEGLRWPAGPVCPHCGSIGAWKIDGKNSRPGLLKCAAYGCYKQFTVTVGTVFERSRIPINKWLMAVHVMCASKKGISAHQLHLMLGLTYKSAWFMVHRIRAAVQEGNVGLLGSGGGTVEVDETFGNERKPRAQGKKGRGYAHKNKILSSVERGGKVRSFHVPAVSAKTLAPILREQIAKDANIMTDEAFQYIKVEREFASHGVVHRGIGGYVRGDLHSNTVEDYFSVFKRGLMGTFHHVSSKHLKRYLCEFDFRYNYRIAAGYSDREIATQRCKVLEGRGRCTGTHFQGWNDQQEG